MTSSPATWSQLGVDDDLVQNLVSRGITSPFPVQQLTIPDALGGADVCGKAKTGSGKTFAFGIPMVQRLPANPETHRPLALALVPTRELCVQVRPRNLASATVETTGQVHRQDRALNTIEPCQSTNS